MDWKKQVAKHQAQEISDSGRDENGVPHGDSKKDQNKTKLYFYIRVRGGEDRAEFQEETIMSEQRDVTAPCFRPEVWVELACRG